VADLDHELSASLVVASRLVVARLLRRREARSLYEKSATLP
jgi:hypothetical protein